MKEQQISYRKISEIHPYEKNPRNNDAAVDSVAKSIKDFGFRVPILIDRDGTIIAGHTRYKAAKQLGLDQVPCILVDDLSEAQIRAYRIADNKVSEASSWNDDILRSEMEALKALDIDLGQTGFSDVEIEGILREMQDSDFEDFFVEPVEKAGEKPSQNLACQDNENQPNEDHRAKEAASKLVQCPHCGEWFET